MSFAPPPCTIPLPNKPSHPWPHSKFRYTLKVFVVLCDPANPKPKTNYQSFGHSVIQSSVIPPTLLAEEIRFLSQNEEIWFSGKNEEIRVSGQNYLHFWEFVKKKKSRNFLLKIEQSSSPSSILASSCTFTFTSCCTVCPRSSDPFYKVTYYRHLDIYLIWEICDAIYNIRLKLCSRNGLKII